MEAARLGLPAQRSRKKKKHSPSQKDGDGGIKKDRVKRDSKRELLTLDPGYMILKAAEFAHMISYSWSLQRSS